MAGRRTETGRRRGAVEDDSPLSLVLQRFAGRTTALWWPGIGITLENWVPPVPTGAGAPTVVIHASATKPIAPYQIKIEITQDGDGTHALFKWSTSLDGGTTWTEQATGLTAGTAVALGTTGCVLQFTAGSYTTSHSYQTASNWSGWTSVVGGHTFAQSTNSKRLAAQYGTNGGPVVHGDGTDDAATVTIAGITQPHTTITVGMWRTGYVDGSVIFDGTTSGGRHCIWCVATGSYVYFYAGTSLPTAGGVVFTDLHAYEMYWNGATASAVYVDGTRSGANVNTGTHNPAGYTLCARYGAGTQYALADVYAIFDFVGALSADDRTFLHGITQTFGAP